MVDLDARIVALRLERKPCREIARILGIREWRVWRANGRAGIKGKVSAYRLDGDPRIPRKPDTRAMADRDKLYLEEAELLDLEAWLQQARLGRLGWEARQPEAYLGRLERALRIARRRA